MPYMPIIECALRRGHMPYREEALSAAVAQEPSRGETSLFSYRNNCYKAVCTRRSGTLDSRRNQEAPQPQSQPAHPLWRNVGSCGRLAATPTGSAGDLVSALDDATLGLEDEDARVARFRTTVTPEVLASYI